MTNASVSRFAPFAVVIGIGGLFVVYFVILWDSTTRPSSPTFFNGACSGANTSPLRFTVEQRLKIAQEHNKIEGWAPVDALHLAHWVSEYQRQNGICGAVGEIGVHMGAFAVPIALTLKGEEKMIAIDIFEDQHKNIDGSGNGSRAKFEGNLRLFGVNVERDMRIVKAASTELTSKDVMARVGPVRLLSIDGGHTAFTTAWDLGIATGACVEGCVVAVDDVTNPLWPAVIEGVYRYLLFDSDQPRGLVPFALYGTKMWFTTPSFHQRYVDMLGRDPYFSVVTVMYPNRAVVNSYDVRLQGLSNVSRPPNVTASQAFIDYMKQVS